MNKRTFNLESYICTEVLGVDFFQGTFDFLENSMHDYLVLSKVRQNWPPYKMEKFSDELNNLWRTRSTYWNSDNPEDTQPVVPMNARYVAGDYTRAVLVANGVKKDVFSV